MTISRINGHIVVTQTNVNVSYYDGSWHQVSSALGGTVNKPRVFYEPNDSVFGIFYYDSGGKFRLYTSPSGATWTEVTAGVPSYFTTPVGSGSLPKMGVGNSLWCMAYPQLAPLKFDTASYNPTTSTWASPGSVTLVALTALTDISDPVYSDADGMWMIAAYGTISGNDATEIWTSTNGSTFTHTKTLSNFIAVKQVQCLGSLWLGYTIAGVAIYSVDKGVTWYNSGVKILVDATATESYVWAGGGGFLELDTGGAQDNALASGRIGLIGTALS